MSIQYFNVGDIAQCPNCSKEFEMSNLDDEELNDFDEYFEHVTTCDG